MIEQKEISRHKSNALALLETKLVEAVDYASNINLEKDADYNDKWVSLLCKALRKAYKAIVVLEDDTPPVIEKKDGVVGTEEFIKEVSDSLKEAYEVSDRLSKGSYADPHAVDAKAASLFNRGMTREDFMEFFRNEETFNTLSPSDRVEIFRTVMTGSSDFTKVLLDEIFVDYQVEHLEVLDRNSMDSCFAEFFLNGIRFQGNLQARPYLIPTQKKEYSCCDSERKKEAVK